MRPHLLNGAILVALAAGLAWFWPRQEWSVVSAQTPASAGSTNTGSTNALPIWKVMEDYFALLARKEVPKASALGERVMVMATNDWKALNFFAWRIFADRGIRHRDSALALRAAKRAAELTRENEPVVLDTYARALFENGQLDEAIKHQKRAVELCPEEAKRIDMEANLNRYVRVSKQRRQ